MSHASNSVCPSAPGLVGGALAMAILDLLVKKKILTLDDAQRVLLTAQNALIRSAPVAGSIDGARIIGEMTEQVAGR